MLQLVCKVTRLLPKHLTDLRGHTGDTVRVQRPCDFWRPPAAGQPWSAPPRQGPSQPSHLWGRRRRLPHTAANKLTRRGLAQTDPDLPRRAAGRFPAAELSNWSCQNVTLAGFKILSLFTCPECILVFNNTTAQNVPKL